MKSGIFLYWTQSIKSISNWTGKIQIQTWILAIFSMKFHSGFSLTQKYDVSSQRYVISYHYITSCMPYTLHTKIRHVLFVNSTQFDRPKREYLDLYINHRIFKKNSELRDAKIFTPKLIIKHIFDEKKVSSISQLHIF